MAHVDLAKTEAKAIGGRIARAVALAAAALALVFLAGILVVVGSSLFLADWLLGSMGWGVLHGLLLFVALAMAAVFVAIGLPARSVGAAFLGGVATAVVLGVVLGLDLANAAYAAIGDALAPSVAIEAEVRPLVVAIVLWSLIGLVGGLVVAVRGADWVAVVALVIVGALVGVLTAPTFGPQVGAALGITVGYLAWIALQVMAMVRTSIDADALKARFYPTQTIETSKETFEWLKTQLPRANGS